MLFYFFFFLKQMQKKKAPSPRWPLDLGGVLFRARDSSPRRLAFHSSPPSKTTLALAAVGSPAGRAAGSEEHRETVSAGAFVSHRREEGQLSRLRDGFQIGCYS